MPSLTTKLTGKKLIKQVIQDDVENLGLKVINGSFLEREKDENLSKELAIVKKNLQIDFAPEGFYLPDADLIIYHPNNAEVVATVLINPSWRQGVAHAGYWKLKLATAPTSAHIRCFLVIYNRDNSYKIGELTTDGDYITREKIL